MSRETAFPDILAGLALGAILAIVLLPRERSLPAPTTLDIPPYLRIEHAGTPQARIVLDLDRTPAHVLLCTTYSQRVYETDRCTLVHDLPMRQSPPKEP